MMYFYELTPNGKGVCMVIYSYKIHGSTWDDGKVQIVGVVLDGKTLSL